MTRRRTKRTSQQRLASELFTAARQLARQSQLALRRSRAASARQARALERLKKEQEREEALASAAEEHAENERLYAEIRELVQLAPAPQRTHRDHEAAHGRVAFPASSRKAAEERLEREVAERVARVALPAHSNLLAMLPWLVLGAALIAVGVWLHGPLGWALIVAAVLVLVGSGWFARSQLARKLAALKSAEETRCREELSAQIAAELERNRAAHEQREEERLVNLALLLQGDGTACANAFAESCAGIELPVEASAALLMRDPENAEIEINLHLDGELPLQRSTLLKTGRISYRNRPKRDVREDDARAIASLCILYAAVAFDALPSLESVLVSAFRHGVEPATGKDADLCYASVSFDRKELAELKLDRIDPIATLRSFEANFSCSATFLLKPVEPLCESPKEADAEGPQLEAEGEQTSELEDRLRWLAALEIPTGARLDRAIVERAAARLGDLYAEEKFDHLAPDLREMAERKRKLIADATRELLRELPEEEEVVEQPLRPGEVRRDNPDLDSIFG